MELGEHIRTLRQERGLSQEALAERLEVSRQAVAKWEHGAANPSTANLISLSRIFEVPLEELIPAEGGEAGKPKKDRWLPGILLAVTSALLLLTAIAFLSSRAKAIPPDIIGYTDAPTEIYLFGKPWLPRVLGILTAGTALAAFIAAWVQRRKKR